MHKNAKKKYSTQIKFGHLQWTSDVVKQICFLSLVPIAHGSKIDVWIQGTKVGEEWFFNDGAQMSTDFNVICPLVLTSTISEIHLRAHGSTTFSCLDMKPSVEYSFMCEYYRQFTIY